MNTDLFQVDDSDCDHVQEMGTYRCTKCKATNFWVMPYKANNNTSEAMARQRRSEALDRRSKAG